MIYFPITGFNSVIDEQSVISTNNLPIRINAKINYFIRHADDVRSRSD